MRRYDDAVEVRKGPEEEPAQFLWRGRLWQVRAVVAHWVETGPWWQAPGVRAVVGSEESSEQALSSAAERTRPGRGALATLEPAPAPVSPHLLAPDLLAEREVWRVEAARPRSAVRLHGREADPDRDDPGFGVFDLVFDWAEGSWRLTGCAD